jgi:hypothetical protein
VVGDVDVAGFPGLARGLIRMTGQFLLQTNSQESRVTYHRTSMYLECLPSIAPAEISVEDHLLVEEVCVEVARALEVRNWRTELVQRRHCGSVLDRGWDGVSLKGPHLHTGRCPQHHEYATASGVQVRASETVGCDCAAGI